VHEQLAALALPEGEVIEVELLDTRVAVERVEQRVQRPVVLGCAYPTMCWPPS